MIDKSQIENIQPEPLPDNEPKADDTSVRPTIGNAVVTGSTVNLRVLNLYAGIGGNRTDGRNKWKNIKPVEKLPF